MSYTKHNFISGDTLLASDLNAMEDQIAANEQTGIDLKSAVDEETAVETLWQVGGIAGGNTAAAGSYTGATIRLTTRRFDYLEFEKCRTINGYAFIFAAWDSDNVFLGKYDGNGFSRSSEGAILTSFDFSQYPDYSFVIALLVQDAPTTPMQISDGVNCIFTKNHLNTITTAIDALSNYSLIIASGENGAENVTHIPVEMKKGETVYVKLMSTTGAAPSCSLYNDGELVKKVFDVIYSGSLNGSSAKCVLPSDCNEIRLYSSRAYTYEVRRVVYGHNPFPVTAELNKTTKLTLYNESLTAISMDSESAQMLGEFAIDSNRQFVPADKMKMVFLDNNYKYFSVANIKLIVDAMAQSGLNYLVLGFGGSGRGLCFELDDMHITSYGITYDLSNCLLTSSGKYLTETDMETIISYAENKNIAVIPSFTMPGHFRPFLNYQPQFRYGADVESVDINNAQARDYAYKCAELYLKWFAEHGCKYWFFGADEFGDITAGYYNLRNAGNYNYALFINQIAYIAAKYRMIPLAWNDAYCIDGNLYPFINRKVPVLYWNKATTHWATTAQISANGNDLINSSKSIYWVANGTQVTEQTMRAFNVHTFEDGTTVADPLGACFCIWIGNRENPSLDDDGDAITTAVLPLIRAFGETITPQFT